MKTKLAKKNAVLGNNNFNQSFNMLKGAFEKRRGRSQASERWGHEQENIDNTFRNGHCGGAAGGCAGARGSCERWFGRQQRRRLFCPRDQQRER
ncbi:MAG TPA: hypothetical protein P5527_01285, partial [Kiritimatiellia bacterium]|nr:hypothetical protein [Kiritimatiellia bacterium]